MQKRKRFFGVLLILVVLALAGCGGGSGTPAPAVDRVSGVAAAGDVIVGTVSLKDSSPTPRELTLATTDGAYSFDVAGMTKPFLLKADGTSNGTHYTLFSLATDKGTANINPMTNLAVSSAAGGADPAAIYASPQAVDVPAIANRLPLAIQELVAGLRPLLAAFSAATVNPITDTYKADHTGLDGMFDVVKFDIGTGIVTITNKITSTTIFTSQVTGVNLGTMDAAQIPQLHAFTSKVYDYSSVSAGVPVAGVLVTTVGLSPEVTTTTDAAGSFVLSGIPQGADFQVRMSKASYADSYSHLLSLTSDQNNSDRPYALYPPSQLAGMGNTAGLGIIRSRVSTSLVNGYLGGVVVTATDQSGGTFPVKYIDSSTGSISSTLTSTDPNNGQYVIVNLPAGKTINVTAALPGFTFTTRTFVTHADAVGQSRIPGTALSAGFSAESLSGKNFLDSNGNILSFFANGTFTTTEAPGSLTWLVKPSGQLVIHDSVSKVNATLTAVSGSLASGLNLYNSQSDGFTEGISLTFVSAITNVPAPSIFGRALTFFAPGQTWATSWAPDATGMQARLSFRVSDPAIVKVVGNPVTVPAGTPLAPQYLATFVALGKSGTATVEVVATHPDGSSQLYGPWQVTTSF